ncbi:alcohol dehydrogenase catalytic domain-containing protein [Vibrio hannami]|uniref:alcohol dehydrogenase catalytic domain-containing protein n=1 Tax=Vibrio hannami TaxID=2717094 RepID=UPI00240F1A17|nr:alcohol dehydrogenase catalytic domain-containing protein [Vibrio hannami]MDG3085058.1 alcohol dehydrogenase catalytic domain-containing protein [Vibrio hannami]
MQQNMVQVIVESNDQLAIEETEVPEVSSTDVLVKVFYSGLCGSDLPRIFNDGAHYYPITLGHEFSGEVVDLGGDVTSIKKGDVISCAPLVPCFNCVRCEKGQFSLCKNYSFVGSRKPGGNAEYVAVPEKSCFVLPEGISAKQGAFFEPVTVGIHPILMAGGCQDKNVVVIGVGTIGLLALQSAKALGAKTVTAVDINDAKLDKAKQLGADICINSLNADEIDSFLANVTVLEEQLILETAGTPITVKLATQLAGPRAQVGLVGTLHKDLHMTYKEFEIILRKELTLFGSWMNYSAPYPGKEWELTAELFQKNLIDIDMLTEGSFAPAEYIEKVSKLQGAPSEGKILLAWGEEK